MFRLVVILVGLLGSPALADSKFKQMIDGASVQIGFGPRSYALTAPEFKQFDWASINVNGGGRLSIVKPDCQIVEVDESSLDGNKRELLAAVNRRLQTPSEYGEDDGYTMYSTRDGICWSKIGSIESEGLTVNKNGDSRFFRMGAKHYAFSEANFPDNIKWIIVSDQMVSFVYAGERAEMRPRSCLDENKRQLLESLEARRRVKQVTGVVQERTEPRRQHDQRQQERRYTGFERRNQAHQEQHEPSQQAAQETRMQRNERRLAERKQRMEQRLRDRGF